MKHVVDSLSYYTFLFTHYTGILGLVPSARQFIRDDPGAEVVEGVFIGSLATATSEYYINVNKIDIILNLSGYTYHSTIPVQSIIMEDKNINVRNSWEYIQKFNTCAKIIKDARENNRRILIHCAAGINRSATAIAYYLISRNHLPSDAISMIREANYQQRNTTSFTNESFVKLIHSHDEESI